MSNSFLIGEEERVPFVRHDMYKNEWEIIGKIIVRGLLDIGYFPTILNKAFVMFCFDEEIEESTLMKSFLKYLSKDEKRLVEDAISENDSAKQAIESEDFADFCEQFNCRSFVTVSNVKQVILEIARQELIQKCHIIASSWRKPFAQLKKLENFSSMENIRAFYENLEPTARKVLALFSDVSTNDTAEKDALNFLKRFIRGLDQIMLKKFLKFTTGADMLIVRKIDILFIKPTSELARRPIAHSCGPTLELPNTYANFCELREEFNNILQLNNWEMDIV